LKNKNAYDGFIQVIKILFTWNKHSAQWNFRIYRSLIENEDIDKEDVFKFYESIFGKNDWTGLCKT
jgi:hypothetical protein